MKFTEAPYFIDTPVSIPSTKRVALSFCPTWVTKVDKAVQQQVGELRNNNGELDPVFTDEALEGIMIINIPGYLQGLELLTKVQKMLIEAGSDGASQLKLWIPMMIVPGEQPGLDAEII